MRVTEGGVRFDRADRGNWIKDQELARHFIDPGSEALDRVDDVTAQRLAKRYGVKL